MERFASGQRRCLQGWPAYCQVSSTCAFSFQDTQRQSHPARALVSNEPASVAATATKAAEALHPYTERTCWRVSCTCLSSFVAGGFNDGEYPGQGSLCERLRCSGRPTSRSSAPFALSRSRRAQGVAASSERIAGHLGNTLLLMLKSRTSQGQLDSCDDLSYLAYLFY